MNERADSQSYLDKPFWRATLAEHARTAHKHWLSPGEAEVRDFLGVESTEMVIREERVPGYDLPHFFHAVKECCGHWKFHGDRGSLHRSGHRFPSWHTFEVRPGQFEDYPADGTRLYRLSDGERRVVVVQEPGVCGAAEYSVGIIAPYSNNKAVDEELAAVRRWMDANHYLKGQTLRPDGTLFILDKKLGWQDIALHPSVLETTHQNTAGLLKRQPVYREQGIPLTRGILLYGPPGGGKTLIGKILANTTDATLVYATAADVEDPTALRHVFALARRLRPSIVFLEDIDLYAFDRQSRSCAGAMGELLAQLDGFEKNDGVICVATTNDLDAIEPALKDRPSRFDVVLEIGLPDHACRRRILEINLSRVAVDHHLLERSATRTDGLTGAQLREVAYLMIQAAITRDDVDPRDSLRITQQDADAAIERFAERKGVSLGFQAA